MPGLLIKELPPELHARLKQEAARHHRSMTRQALMLLEQALQGGSAKPRVAPPEPVDMGTLHDSEWVYRAAREGRE
ncbi:MAG: hypothetical protein K8F27_15045 [Sulfuricellaceae bacterium]|nr:hypothetical protein [Sulfuricellaceae bacterium]